MAALRIGVLAIQGAFIEHVRSVQKAYDIVEETGGTDGKVGRLEVVEVRTCGDIEGLDGLILPGGESTTMTRFMDRNGLMTKVTQWMKGDGTSQPCVWGTCAGLILLSDRTQGVKIGGQSKIGGLNVTTLRNSYGRQRESFETNVTVNPKLGGEEQFPGVFIRAPGIASVDSDDVTVLASLQTEDGERVVGVEQGHIMACSFHPELTDDFRWHVYFIRKVKANLKRNQ